MSIRGRLILAFLVVLAAGFWYLVDGIIEELRPRYLEAVEESLVDTAQALSAVLAESAGERGLEFGGLGTALEKAGRRRFEARIYDLTKTRFDLRVYVTDTRGVVIFDSDGGRAVGEDYSRWNDVLRTLRGEYGARSTRRDPDDQASSVLYVAAPVLVRGVPAGVLTVCKPTDNLVRFIDAARRKAVRGVVIVGLGVVCLAALTTVWLTLPIRRLTAYATAVRDGHKAELPPLGKGDIANLGRAFEGMRRALEGKDYVEKYVQALTHEMKGPLAGIRGAAELLLEDMPAEHRSRFLANIREETARMELIVERLLLLASVESRRELKDVEHVDLGDLAGEVAATMEPVAAARGIEIALDLPHGSVVAGERFLLRHAVGNLLRNAIEFSTPGGRVTVRLEREEREGRAKLRVEDSGPGIPGYAIEKVFERFFSLPRPDTGRKSSGLGLPFVREVAELHGGSASLSNLPGRGAVAVLVLPLLEEGMSSVPLFRVR